MGIVVDMPNLILYSVVFAGWHEYGIEVDKKDWCQKCPSIGFHNKMHITHISLLVMGFIGAHRLQSLTLEPNTRITRFIDYIYKVIDHSSYVR